MASGEPETKKQKLDGRDPIFDQFRNDKEKMQLLDVALRAMTKADNTRLKLCMKKILCEDANAETDVPFSSATVRTENYTTIDWNSDIRQNCGIAAGIIFLEGIIILEKFFHDGKLPKSKKIKMVLAKLLKFLSESDHDVLLERKKYEEAEWAVIIVQHLISKLTVDSNYILDSSYSNKPLEKCPCKDHDDLVTTSGDTSYGCLKGWLGQADILVVDNVPVNFLTNKPHEIPDDQSDTQSVDNVPVNFLTHIPHEIPDDQSDTQSVDNVPVNFLTNIPHEIPDDQSDTQSVSSVSSVEIKSKDVFRPKDDLFQLMAQTIAFSFIQEKYNGKKLRNFLVPGIGIDAKSLLFYFYDCENDLLMGTTCLETFSPKIYEPLPVEHVVFLWLTLNYRYFCTGPDEFMKNYQAGFKHAEKYRKEVQMHVHRKPSARNETPWYDSRVNVETQSRGKIRKKMVSAYEFE